MDSRTKEFTAIFAGLAIGMISISIFMIAHFQYPYFLEWLSRYAYAENDNLVCSSSLGFEYYNRFDIAESIKKDSNMTIVIGTIESVETKMVDWYIGNPMTNRLDGSATPQAVYEPTGDKIPWKYVTVQAEKYLLDETGNYSNEITFKTAANACVDNTTGILVLLPSSDPASDPDKSAKFNVGDRSIIEIHKWKDDELDATGTIKLDIDYNDMIKPDYRKGIDEPIRLDALEKEITAEIERAGASTIDFHQYAKTIENAGRLAGDQPSGEAGITS